MGKGGRQTERRDCVKTSQLGVICGRKCVTDIKQDPLSFTEVNKSSINEKKNPKEQIYINENLYE